MAIRQEELLVTEAIVYRLPTAGFHARAARERMFRRRRMALGIAAITVASTALALSGPPPEAGAGARSSAPDSVTVAQGDTMWDLAERYAPADSDLRGYVAALTEANDLEGPIHPGMRLKLPR